MISPIFAERMGKGWGLAGSIHGQTPRVFLSVEENYVPYPCAMRREDCVNFLNGKSEISLILTQRRGEG